MLSDEQIDGYHRDGFLVIEGFASPQQCADLKRRAIELVQSWEPTAERTVFTTEQQERVSNHEFLSSGATTWCFFEEEAFDETGALRQAKELSINKICLLYTSPSPRDS